MMKFRSRQLLKRDTGKFFFQGQVIGFYILIDGRQGYVLQNGINTFMALEEDLQDATPVHQIPSEPIC